MTDNSATPRVAVTAWLETGVESDDSRPGRTRDVTAGILVHRLFQWAEVLAGCDADAELAYARGLLQPEERAVIEDVDATVETAVAAWRTMRARPDVAALLANGRRFHEVPFSMRMVRDGASVVLRGTIDCVIHKDDGSIAVVEFKTGRRRPFHQQQLDLYVDAVLALFPGTPVEGRLVYSD